MAEIYYQTPKSAGTGFGKPETGTAPEAETCRQCGTRVLPIHQDGFDDMEIIPIRIYRCKCGHEWEHWDYPEDDDE